jgi:hypothetical protein
VIAIASSAGKAEAAMALGARHGFALQQVSDPVAPVLSATGGGARTWSTTPAAGIPLR